MENITIIGLKEMNQKLGKIERHLEDISKSLALLAKVVDRQFPRVTFVNKGEPDPREIYTPDEEDDDDMR